MIRQAGLRDVERLVVLFCSGAEGIRLKPETCLPENRDRLRSRMREWCEHQRVWVLSEVDQLSGMVIVERFGAYPISGIEDLVVAETYRGQHRVGRALVKYVQALPRRPLAAPRTPPFDFSCGPAQPNGWAQRRRRRSRASLVVRAGVTGLRCGTLCVVDDAVARYRTASEENDIDGLIATLAPDAELISPLSGRLVFRGHDDLRVLLSAVYGDMKGLRWREELGDGATRVVLGDGSIGPFKLSDAMVCELDADGQIRRIRPYLRPWLALTFLALRLGPKMARHPDAVLRAARRS